MFASCAQNPHEKYSAYAHGEHAGLFTIRVVLHLIHESSCYSSSCGYLSDACLRSGIDMLNEDFRGVHAGADVGIEFALADKDPDNKVADLDNKFTQKLDNAVKFVKGKGKGNADARSPPPHQRPPAAP